MEKDKTIEVSQEFVDAYLNFNVFRQEDRIRALSEKERYLLLTLALDKHSDEDPVVVENFQPFREEVMRIYDVQDDKETEDRSILELIEETGDKYIDTDCVRDSQGNKLREPYDKQEAREAKINSAISDSENN